VFELKSEHQKAVVQPSCTNSCSSHPQVLNKGFFTRLLHEGAVDCTGVAMAARQTRAKAIFMVSL
jgi:hypothetical protein